MDLSTSYLGLPLSHPIVPSASPFSETLDGVRSLEDAGAPAIVMHSLFEEQLTADSRQLDHYLSFLSNAHAEALTYFPEQWEYHVGPEQYLNKIRAAREAVAVPLIGSLNGVSGGGWVEYARMIEEAGAHALELNVYYLPTDPWLTGRDVEKMYVDVVTDVRAAITIPLARQGRALLLGHGEHGAAPRRGRGRRAGAVQQVLSARHRPGALGGPAKSGPQHVLRDAVAAPMDRASPRQGRR